MTADAATLADAPRCYDCRAPYGGNGWCDFVIPNDLWAQISPTGDEGGILCATCIAKRLWISGLSTDQGRFTSGPLCQNKRSHSAPPAEEVMEVVKRLRERYAGAEHGDAICLEAADMMETLSRSRQGEVDEAYEKAARLCDGYAAALKRDADTVHADPDQSISAENRGFIVKDLLARASAARHAAARIRSVAK